MSIERVGIVGVSALRGGADVLEPFTISKGEQERRLPEIARRLGVEEMVYLATCNRVEVAFRAGPEGDVGDYRARMFRVLAERDPRPGEAERLFRAWAGEGAAEHLFLVASGFDSAQVCEREIRAQVREALKLARTTGVSGPVLDHLFDEALRVAGEVHRRVRADGERTSLADVAVERLVDRYGRTPGPVALIGVTPVTRRCGRAMAREGAPVVLVNRTPARAAELARELRAELRSLDEFRSRPDRVEAVLSSTGSGEPVLGRSELERIAAGCPSGQPPLIVDLSVPPDVDPRAVREVDVEYLSIDEINQEAAATRQRRLLELGPAREVVDEALDALRVRLAERILSPAIARLNQRYRHTASEGLERLFRRELRGIDDEARRAITQWAEVLARRLAHVPVMGLRGLAARGGAPAVRAFLEASGEDCFADVLEVAERLEAFDDANERETEP